MNPLKLLFSSKASPKHAAKEEKRRLKEPALVAADGLVRLNLGCGDKILKGYINADIAPSRRETRPQILCDQMRLSFQDDSADEILSVHNIEHFYLWEARTVVSEWLRILKPGGRLIVECPNLLNAAKELLKNPEEGACADKKGQMTMWVFYGDPGWKDPLMCHKWGYTPASLGRLLEDCGFQKVRREAALYKKREPRDMRVTAVKPARKAI